MATKLKEDEEVKGAATAVAGTMVADATPDDVMPIDSIGAQYLIKTQNPNYSGKVFGIAINEGRGILNAALLDPKIKMTVEQIVADLRTRPGYTVTKLG